MATDNALNRFKKGGVLMAIAPHEQLPDHDRPHRLPDAEPVSEVRRARNTPPWWFALPAALLFAFVVLVPSVRGVYYAFTDWDGLDPHFSFVGLDNFSELFRDPDARQAIWHTLLIAVSITVIQNALGLLLALGVNSAIKSRNVLRVLLFAPAVITPIVTAYLWRNLLGPDGAVNSLLSAVGLGSLRQDWLGSPTVALWSVVGVIVWQFAGYSMVIFLAGLQSVPKEVHEAASMDGAGPVRRFWSVTRPLLAPALTINLMLSIIGGIKLFDQVYALTGGGPGHATDTLSTLIYKDAFTLGEFGYSIALAVILTIIVAVVSTGQYAVLSRNERATS
ncbi:ABC transporter, permease protein [Streptomyces turgidiscabies Car8]|uniref:ABC transporter, permease protein n=2 Tax=Streptomyces TaxID=1883 RepID=L7EVY3_STRT8|nr:ABC transporter, permease protein [Streptomyces turgidiscabies Car8]